MKIIGLTGSIGMGKSTVTKMMNEMGIPSHDADAAVHKALSVGGKAIAPLKEVFAEVVEIDKNGGEYINRQKLGALVFGNSQKLKQLENILHPIAIASSDAFIKNCRQKGVEFAVLDIPLLFETGAEKRVDVTFCVSAAKSVQRARVLKRDGMTEEKFENILKRQMPDSEKRARADYVIKTDTSIEETRKQLKDTLLKLRP